MSKIPSIPDFADGDIRGISVSVRVIKQMLETLTGQRQDDSKGAPHVYLQATEPKVGVNLFKTGDFWINSNEKKLYYWDSFWRAVG